MDVAPDAETHNTIRFHRLKSLRDTTMFVQKMCNSLGYPSVSDTKDALFVVCRHRDPSLSLTDHQRYNHIPGEQVMNKKDMLHDLLYAYQKRTQTPAIMPETYRLDVESQVRDLISLLQKTHPSMPVSPPSGDQEDIDDLFASLYEQIPTGDVKWIYKPTDALAHNGRGIYVLSEDQLCSALVGRLAGRSACIQRYIARPLLLGGHKFDLRLYMCIANVEPAVVLYHSGIARRAVDPFVLSGESSLNVHITNVQNVKDKKKEDQHTLKTATLSPEDLAALKSRIEDKYHLDAFVCDLDALQDRLEAEGSVPANWVKKSLIPQVKHIVKTAFLAARSALSSNPRHYALMGVDVIVDADLRPWLLEIQKSPSMDPGGKMGASDSLPFKRELVWNLWRGHLKLIWELYQEQRRRAEQLAAARGRTLTKGAGQEGCVFMRKALRSMAGEGGGEIWRGVATNKGTFEVVLDEFTDGRAE